MTKGARKKPGEGELRRRAEERVGRSGDVPVTGVEAQRLVHELQVHQIELELQNEELLRTRTEVEDGLARYTDLYELAPVGYLSLGRNGEILQVNLTGARLLGVERAHLAGRRLGFLVAPESGADFDAFVARVFADGTRQDCEVTIRPAGAPPLAIALTGEVVAGGQQCRVVATDITARKRAEHERELLQHQLAQAQKMESIGTFAGGIAHDFNNILGGILGGLSLLDLKLGAGNVHHADIARMEAAVDRGAELTRQLLGFARRGKYDVRPLDLAQVIERSSALFGRTRVDVAVRIDIAPGLQAVLMDLTQLEQVLLNLLANAGQAMPAGGRLYLGAENAVRASENVTPGGAASARFVKLTVADTGVGMDAATQARIFEPFFTTKSPGQGTGLGLSSVYGIVKGHGGSIEVASEPGQGATFTLFLPATDRPVMPEKRATPPIPRGKGTVLVVDDEEQILHVYEGLLSSIGYDVLTATGGARAIEIVGQYGEGIALVILDLTMPEMSGSQTFDALKRIAPGIKVLLSSGFSLDGQAQGLLSRGCDGFIQKPVNLSTLAKAIDEII